MKEGEKMKISLKAWRVNSGLSVPKVLERLEEKGVKISKGTLGNYEKKPSKTPMNVAEALAEIYGVSVNDIDFS